MLVLSTPTNTAINVPQPNRVSYLYTNKAKCRREKSLFRSFCLIWASSTAMQLLYAFVFQDHYMLTNAYHDAGELAIALVLLHVLKEQAEPKSNSLTIDEIKKSNIVVSFGLGIALIFLQIMSNMRYLHHAMENTKINETLLAFGWFRCLLRAFMSAIFAVILHDYRKHPISSYICLSSKKGEYSNAISIIDACSKWDSYKEIMHVGFNLCTMVFIQSVLEYTLDIWPYDVNSIANLSLAILNAALSMVLTLAIAYPSLYSGFRNLMQGIPFGVDVLLRETEKKIKCEYSFISRIENVRTWMADYTRIICMQVSSVHDCSSRQCAR